MEGSLVPLRRRQRGHPVPGGVQLAQLAHAGHDGRVVLAGLLQRLGVRAGVHQQLLQRRPQQHDLGRQLGRHGEVQPAVQLHHVLEHLDAAGGEQQQVERRHHRHLLAADGARADLLAKHEERRREGHLEPVTVHRGLVHQRHLRLHRQHLVGTDKVRSPRQVAEVQA